MGRTARTNGEVVRERRKVWRRVAIILVFGRIRGGNSDVGWSWQDGGECGFFDLSSLACCLMSVVAIVVVQLLVDFKFKFAQFHQIICRISYNLEQFQIENFPL